MKVSNQTSGAAFHLPNLCRGGLSPGISSQPYGIVYQHYLQAGFSAQGPRGISKPGDKVPEYTITLK